MNCGKGKEERKRAQKRRVKEGGGGGFMSPCEGTGSGGMRTCGGKALRCCHGAGQQRCSRGEIARRVAQYVLLST
jgi:hypothetical protein